MFGSLKKLYNNAPNMILGYSFKKDIDKLLRYKNKSIPKSNNPSDERTGRCEIRPDDGRPVYISDFIVRNIACRQAGYEVANSPGTIR